MDPRDYVWGGGYNTSFQGYQQPGYSPAYGEPYCYPQAQPQGCGYNTQHGYGNCYQGSANTMAPSNNMSFPAPTSATEDSNNSMRSKPGTNGSDARASDNEVLDSKVDDLLDLDDAALRKLLKPCETNEAAFVLATEGYDDCSPKRKPPRLEPMLSGASNASEADELIMPDFGEAFDRSDAMLLTITSASAGVEASDIRLGDNMDAGNPYLTPLLDPSMHSGGTMDASQNCYAAETQGSSPSSALPSKDTAETAFGNALSDMSIADAIKCITGFLKTDSRIPDEKRQAAIAAVQGVAPRKGVVVSLRKPSIIKSHPKRKRSSLTKQQQ